jgi:hypothetical protein
MHEANDVMSESQSNAVTRRSWLAAVTRVLAATIVTSTTISTLAEAAGPTLTKLTVYKDPSCGCCTKWVEHLRANGFAPDVHDRTDVSALKDSLGVPTALRSCHTAVIGKYVIEGHVPSVDIRRLLATRPGGIIGLAVPDMPSGSPGMEMGGRADRYDVMAFGSKGATRVFATHG